MTGTDEDLVFAHAKLI